METTTKSEILSIQRLLSMSEDGGYAVPLFQRGFVWKLDDVLALLDSIYKSYPIGSLLLWKPPEGEIRKVALKRLDGGDAAEGLVRFIVLDGQQRLRTVLGALTGKGPGPEDGSWNLFFDLKEHKFLRVRSTGRPAPHQFPLAGLLDTFTYLQNCEVLRKQLDGKLLTKEADQFASKIRDFSMPVVTIEGASFQYAAEVFGRINSAGDPLSEADLLAAKLWRHGFDFRARLESLRAALPSPYREISETVLMKTMLAAETDQVTIDRVDSLYEKGRERLEHIAAQCVDGIKRAVLWLREEIELPGLWYLPYGLHLILLADVMRLHPTPGDDIRDLLKQWFWSTAFSGFFAGANTATQNTSVKQIRALASSGAPSALAWFNKNQIVPALRKTSNLRSTRPRLTSLVMAAQQPMSIDQRAHMAQSGLLPAHGPQFVRIFWEGPPEEQAALANHVLYEEAALQRLEFPLKNLLEGASAAVLRSHLLDEECHKLLRANERTRFLRARHKLIAAAEEEFLVIRQVDLPIETAEG